MGQGIPLRKNRMRERNISVNIVYVLQMTNFIILLTLHVLKLLTYLVSQKIYFSGGSDGGVSSPPTGQEAPSGNL